MGTVLALAAELQLPKEGKSCRRMVETLSQYQALSLQRATGVVKEGVVMDVWPERSVSYFNVFVSIQSRKNAEQRTHDCSVAKVVESDVSHQQTSRALNARRSPGIADTTTGLLPDSVILGRCAEVILHV